MAASAAKRKRDEEDEDEVSVNVKRKKEEDTRHADTRQTRTQGHADADADECVHLLRDIHTCRVLKQSARDKKIHVHGKLADADAVIILEKTPITADVLDQMFSASRLELDMKNDIYSTYRLQAPAHLNEIKVTVVCPAGPQMLQSFRRQERFLVEETWEDYQHITLPFFRTNKNVCVQWIHNILNKTAEAHRVVYEDPDPNTGFVLLPDSKWDMKQLDDLHLLAIVRRRDIRSLRDLTPEHLPLLYKVFREGTRVILQRYNLSVRLLCVYVHYQPSSLHFHVHFTRLGSEVPGSGADRAHLLPDVIQNLHSDPQYYQTRTLYFPLRANDKLLRRFKKAGRF